MEQKLKETIEKIVLLSQQNEEFCQELKNRLGNISQKTSPSSNTEIKKDVKIIRETLQIRANPSINYDFISNQRLRDQLTIDNLRMENVALDLSLDERSRFFAFSLNVFYQVENMVNYYFNTTHPDFEDLLDCIEDGTQFEQYPFKRNEKTKSITSIAIYNKINAICNILNLGLTLKITLNQLRHIRNQEDHRCTDIEDKNAEIQRQNYYKNNTYEKVRNYLKELVEAIKIATYV